MTIALLIGAGWASMMNRINAGFHALIFRPELESKQKVLFWSLVGLDFMLIATGSTIGWAFIPALRIIHVFA